MNFKKHIIFGLVALSLLAQAQKRDKQEIISDDNLKSSLVYLASDELQGRLTGSEGEKKASAFLEKKLKSFGLKTELQDFSYSVRPDRNPHSTPVKVTGRNVIGYLNNKAERTIIIGAHYDHLGLNEHNNSTLPNSKGMIHNGADDNASGVSSVLEIARMFSKNKTKEKANFLFVLFSGEEDGLMGSKAFAETVKEKYPKPIAMINLDMVGRLNAEKALTVGGVGTSPLFGSLIEKHRPEGVKIAIDSSGVGPSDHTSFYSKDLPVLFLFTGVHSDYHKPSDDSDKINYEGLKIITQYVFDIAKTLSQREEIPFTKTKMKKTDVPSFKVTIGVMPSFIDADDGLHIESVSEGRPADKAGIQQGDILIKLGECQITNIYTYMECLSKLKSGDEVPAQVKRGDKILNLSIKL